MCRHNKYLIENKNKKTTLFYSEFDGKLCHGTVFNNNIKIAFMNI